ncbi:unnamed protein product, partial [Laminaria digitata]
GAPPPPTLKRLSSSGGSSSLSSNRYLSCLSSDTGNESPLQELEGERLRRSRSISSPLPLAMREFDTPLALTSSGGGKPSGARDDFDDGGGVENTPAGN